MRFIISDFCLILWGTDQTPNTIRFRGYGTESNSSVDSPVLAIKAECLVKLFAYVEECSGEISGFGTISVDPDTNTLLLEDVSILPQRISSVSVDIDANDIADFLVEEIAKGNDPNKLRVWWHSHAEMPVFFSSTDIHTIENSLTQAPWLVSLVVNKKGEMKAAFTIYDPVKIWIDDIPVKVHVEPNIREEVRADIAKYVTKIYTYTYDGTQTHTQNGHSNTYHHNNKEVHNGGYDTSA